MRTQYVHACPHCGQMLTFSKQEPDLSDMELDRIAELKCTCPGAARARWIIDSEEVVENVLGKNCTQLGMKYPVNEDALQFAKALLGRIYDGTIDKVTFSEFFGDKISMETGTAKVKMKRTHTTTLKM